MVEVAELEPERDATDGGEDGDDTIVPDQVGVLFHICQFFYTPEDIGMGSGKDKLTEARYTSAKPMAELMAFMNKATAWTMERIFAGALLWAYSREVILARISEKAMRT